MWSNIMFMLGIAYCAFGSIKSNGSGINNEILFGAIILIGGLLSIRLDRIERRLPPECKPHDAPHPNQERT